MTTLEQGAAALTLSVRKGQLKVKHSDGSLLLAGPLPEGGWRLIVAAILAAAPEADGPMRRAK